MRTGVDTEHLVVEVAERVSADPLRGSAGCSLVRLTGAVTAATQQTLSVSLGELFGNGARIVIDLTAVSDADVVGLLTLIEEVRLARIDGCVVLLTDPSPAVRQLLAESDLAFNRRQVPPPRSRSARAPHESG